MKIQELFTDDDAVSPVIGVILMVAITVILAAVIGAFVLDIGGSQETVPQASWDFSYDSSNDIVEVSHDGGDSVDPAQLSFSGTHSSGTSFSEDADTGDWNVDSLNAGSSIKIGDNPSNGIDAGGPINSDDGVTLTWTSSGGDQSQVLQEWSGPDA